MIKLGMLRWGDYAGSKVIKGESRGSESEREGDVTKEAEGEMAM